MDILKAEIERKRKQIKKAEVVAPEKKYFRRGDLGLKQQEEYWTKYYQKHSIQKDTQEELCVGSDQAVDILEEDEEKQSMSREVVVKRLRERAEPIRLFGESDRDALRRLRRLEIEAPELKEGRRNDFKDAMDQVDREYVKEVAEGRLHEAGRHDVKVDAKLANIEEIIEMSKDLGKDSAGRDCEIVYAFFNYIMQRWGHDLNARSENVKRSGEGKFASARHTQTIQHTKPLFNKLKNKGLKRCMTKCQEYFPSDPSKCVDYTTKPS